MPEDHQSWKGHLLLDSGQLTGSFFHRSVILVCHHDAEGAFGLVLNRGTGKKVEDALVADLPDGLRQQPLYLGGPVQPTVLSYLHSGVFIPDANVIANLNVGHSLESLVEIAGSYSPMERLKVFAGYAGWGPGQLDGELQREAWLTHPASVDLVFRDSPDNLWREVLHTKGWKYRLLAEIPDDLSWN